MGTFLARKLSGLLPLERLLNQLSTAGLFLPVTSQKWSLVLRVWRLLAAADAEEELDDGGSPRVFWRGFLAHTCMSRMNLQADDIHKKFTAEVP